MTKQQGHSQGSPDPRESRSSNMSNLFLLAQVRQPGRTPFADLSGSTWHTSSSKSSSQFGTFGWSGNSHACSALGGIRIPAAQRSASRQHGGPHKRTATIVRSIGSRSSRWQRKFSRCHRGEQNVIAKMHKEIADRHRTIQKPQGAHKEQARRHLALTDPAPGMNVKTEQRKRQKQR